MNEAVCTVNAPSVSDPLQLDVRSAGVISPDGTFCARWQIESEEVSVGRISPEVIPGQHARIVLSLEWCRSGDAFGQEICRIEYSDGDDVTFGRSFVLDKGDVLMKFVGPVGAQVGATLKARIVEQ